MNGMRGYYARYKDSDAKESVLILTTTFKFSLGLLFDPDDSTPADPRLDLLSAVTTFLDGVIFTPSALLDAYGRALFGADGEVDPQAIWPRVRAEIKIDHSRDVEASEIPPSTEEDTAVAPTAERVARRALALTAVAARALLEQKGTVLREPKTTSWNPLNWFSNPEKQRRDLLRWLTILGIEEEIEPEEWEVLQKPIGLLDSRQHIDSTWRLEGLVVLAWGLGRFEVPAHDELVSPWPLLSSMHVLDAPAAKSLLVHAQLRPRSEIETLRARLFALHWRLLDFRLRPEAMNFSDFARTASFGPLDITGLSMVEQDLAVTGQRLDRAQPEARARAESAVRERHMAINWLCEGPVRYSQARADT